MRPLPLLRRHGRSDHMVLMRVCCRIVTLFVVVVIICRVSCGESVSNKPSNPTSPSSSSSSSSSRVGRSDAPETTEPESANTPDPILDVKSNVNDSGSGRVGTKSKSPGQVISLAESINRSTKLYLYPDPERARASKEQWERALQEIKNLSKPSRSRARNGRPSLKSLMKQPPVDAIAASNSLDSSSSSPSSDTAAVPSNAADIENDESSARKTKSENLGGNSNKYSTNKWMFSQWRSTTSSSDSIPRFEGFASWERILQDWTDDVQEYLEKMEAENSSGEGYPMSTYGKTQSSSSSARPSSSSSSRNNEAISKKQVVPRVLPLDSTSNPSTVDNGDNQRTNPRRKKSVSLPIPAPAREGEAVVPHTDISDKSKRIWITTTASLPWMTGTAVNPLLRAAYMLDGREEAGGSVTLMVPWLERPQDQEQVYGAKRFETPSDQETYIRTWLCDKAGLPEASQKLRIEWYTAWQNKAENSVYSMGDITALIPEDEVDIMILEEPEHLNWYRAPGESWTDKFKHVVGIVHTNYFVYAQEQPAAFIRAPAMRLLCSWMCRAHCHRLIKLSGTLGQFAPEKELIENVHGIRSGFLDAGLEVAKRIEDSPNDDPVFGAEAEPSVYFIGKMLWSKGIGSLMELLKYAEESAGIKIHVDMYGGGPDKQAAETRAKSLDVDMEFHGPIDHGELAFSHKIFINPSTSEVLCTTVAEALGMGKFVVVPSHPSNDFFNVFPNCLTYTNKEEFVGNLYYALTHSPEPMTKEFSHALSWQAATERLEAAGSIPVEEARLMQQALSSDDARVEISLPPLIEDEEGRKLVATGLRRSRSRYRQFRSRLSQEVMQSKVLPARMKERFITELDKRLEVDIDQVLDSPKLRLQLSPAELDKQLLELYKKVADGPSGDILRLIGGGQEVGLQDLYIKRKAARERAKNPHNQNFVTFGPFQALGDDSDEEKRTASQWVNLVLRRNLPPRSEVPQLSTDDDLRQRKGRDNEKQQSKTQVSMWTPVYTRTRSPCLSTECRHALPPTHYTRHSCLRRSPIASFSLLI